MGSKNQLINQYLAGISVNIISITYGTIYAWPLVSFIEVPGDDSSLESGPIINTEALLCIGGILGTILFSVSADLIGRKLCLMIMTIPALLSWIIIIYAQNLLHLYLSRFTGGIVGGILAVVPLYVAEISQMSMRGVLGSLIVPSVNVGILVAFILEYYFSYLTTTIILALLPLVFLLAFVAFPDTPQFLSKKGRLGAAEASLHFYRNTIDHFSDDFRWELERFKVEQRAGRAQISWNTKVARKALGIGVMLMVLSQLCGSVALMNYTATIFQKSNLDFPLKVSAILIAFIMLFGSCVSTFLVERVGRKVLLTISSIGTCVGLTVLAFYDYLNVIGFDMQDYNLVPITSFAFTIFIASCGVEPLPFVIVTEIMPFKIRNIGCMLCVTTLWLSRLFTICFIPIMHVYLGMHGMMFLLAGASLVGVNYIIMFVPETQGKTLEEIHLLL